MTQSAHAVTRFTGPTAARCPGGTFSVASANSGRRSGFYA
jgi:hypothetical protein